MHEGSQIHTRGFRLEQKDCDTLLKNRFSPILENLTRRVLTAGDNCAHWTGQANHQGHEIQWPRHSCYLHSRGTERSRYSVGNSPVPGSRPDRSHSGKRGSRTSPLLPGIAPAGIAIHGDYSSLQPLLCRPSRGVPPRTTLPSRPCAAPPWATEAARAAVRTGAGSLCGRAS